MSSIIGLRISSRIPSISSICSGGCGSMMCWSSKPLHSSVCLLYTSCNVELLLSQHDCECAYCSRSGNCSLQKISNDLGITSLPYEKKVMYTPWNQSFPLIRESNKCIKCMRCIQICDKVQNLQVWDVQNTGSRTTVNVSLNRSIEEAECSLCGQCITCLLYTSSIRLPLIRKQAIWLSSWPRKLWKKRKWLPSWSPTTWSMPSPTGIVCWCFTRGKSLWTYQKRKRNSWQWKSWLRSLIPWICWMLSMMSWHSVHNRIR